MAATPVPAPAAAKGKPGRKPGPVIAPEITAVSSAVPMPPRPTAGRAQKSIYPFDLLEVGGSFGVKNKTAEQLGSVVSNQNKRARVPQRDTLGNIVYEMTDATGPTGESMKVPTANPVLIDGKTYFVVNVDPATDPDGATARVFRDK